MNGSGPKYTVQDVVPVEHYELKVSLLGDFISSFEGLNITDTPDPLYVISQIRFEQIAKAGNVVDDGVRSRIFGLHIYNALGSTVSSRSKDSITLNLDFEGKDYSGEGIMFRPVIHLQDKFGDYSTEVVRNSERIKHEIGVLSAHPCSFPLTQKAAEDTLSSHQVGQSAVYQVTVSGE